MPHMRKILLSTVALATLLLVSCKEENYLAEESRTLMLYQKNPTDGNLLALAEAQGETLAKTAKSKDRQPGQYADYAVSLAKLGLQDEANRWFNKERTTFPASKRFVDAMKARYCGQYAADTAALPASAKPNEKLLAGFMFNDADSTLEPQLPDVSDDFDDDPASIAVDVDQNPEMTAKEVEALQRSKRAKTDEEKAALTKLLSELFVQDKIVIDGQEYTCYCVDLVITRDGKKTYQRFAFRQNDEGQWILCQIQIGEYKPVKA